MRDEADRTSNGIEDQSSGEQRNHSEGSEEARKEAIKRQLEVVKAETQVVELNAQFNKLRKEKKYREALEVLLQLMPARLKVLELDVQLTTESDEQKFNHMLWTVLTVLAGNLDLMKIAGYHFTSMDRAKIRKVMRQAFEDSLRAFPDGLDVLKKDWKQSSTAAFRKKGRELGLLWLDQFLPPDSE